MNLGISTILRVSRNEHQPAPTMQRKSPLGPSLVNAIADVPMMFTSLFVFLVAICSQQCRGRLIVAGETTTAVKLWELFASRPDSLSNRTCVERGEMECGLSDEEAAFMARTYDIVGLGACFGGTNIYIVRKENIWF